MNKGTVYQVFVSNEKGDLVKIGTINGKIPSKKNCELMRRQVEVNKRLSCSSLIDKSIILEDYIELDGSTNYGEVINYTALKCRVCSSLKIAVLTDYNPPAI